MANVDHLEEQIIRIEEQIKNPDPTPCVPDMVTWYDRGVVSPETGFAAIVTGVEGPGRVKLTVFKPNAMPTHKVGVFHVSNPQHKIVGNACTVKNGAWDYPPGEKAPKSHFAYHEALLRQRIVNIRREIDSIQNSEAGKRQLAEAAK